MTESKTAATVAIVNNSKNSFLVDKCCDLLKYIRQG